MRIDSPELNECIFSYKKAGYLVILYAHCGSLFSRYPNPQIKEIIESAIDSGAGCIVTAHSHCLGGSWSYKGVPIIYSLGDFLMDGSSYRRRKSCILTLTINKNILSNWKIKPVVTNIFLTVEFPKGNLESKMMASFEKVSKRIDNAGDYTGFYNKQYKIEMLYHSLSSLYFIYDIKGIYGFLKMLNVRRREVMTMLSRMVKGRANMRYDSDAVDTGLKNSDIK